MSTPQPEAPTTTEAAPIDASSPAPEQVAAEALGVATPEDTIAAEPAAPPEPKVTATDFARFKAKVDALKAKEGEYKATAAELAQTKARLSQYQDLARSNPAALLEELGIDHQALIESITQPYLDPTSQVKRELEQLKSQLAKRDQEAQEASERQNWESVQLTFAQHVKSTPELELLQSELKDAPEAVYSTLRSMVQIATERGEQITFRQAAAKYEDYLTAQALRYAGSSKIKTRFAPPEPPAPAKQEKASTAQTEPQQNKSPAQVPKTINNEAAQEAAPPKSPAPKMSKAMEKMMAEESKKRALIEKLQKVNS